MTHSRREMLAALFAATAASQAPASQRAGTEDSPAFPGKRPMILHNDRPEDLESFGAYFDTWVTPVDSFFVRQHLPRPAPINPGAYKLTINGMVSGLHQVRCVANVVEHAGRCEDLDLGLADHSSGSSRGRSYRKAVRETVGQCRGECIS